MKILFFRLFLFLTIYVSSSVQSFAQKSNEYTVLPKSSELVAKVFKTGIASVFADNHIIRASDFSGEILFDTVFLSFSTISFEVKTNSLIPDEPVYRKKYGLTSKLSNKDREIITEHMFGSDQLNVKKFPIIVFRSSIINHIKDSIYTITGDFTLHGITKKMSFPATIKLNNGYLRSQGQFCFRQSDFNIVPYSTALGTIKNQDVMIIIFNIVAVLSGK
jgi:polyisoprenoid-binding protein YceI